MSNIQIVVTQQEIAHLIEGMSNCIYRRVVKAIDELKYQMNSQSDNPYITVSIDTADAKVALNAIFKMPFCDVFELVGKLNEQLQAASSIMEADEAQANISGSVSKDSVAIIGDVAGINEGAMVNSVTDTKEASGKVIFS